MTEYIKNYNKITPSTFAFCPNCGEELDLDVIFEHEADGLVYFCYECGTLLIGEYVGDYTVFLRQAGNSLH